MKQIAIAAALAAPLLFAAPSGAGESYGDFYMTYEADVRAQLRAHDWDGAAGEEGSPELAELRRRIAQARPYGMTRYRFISLAEQEGVWGGQLRDRLGPNAVGW